MRNIIYPDEYLELIAAASKRGLTKKAAKELGIGGQMHHIIPRCVAPELTKEKSNIVFLTHEEHYNAHKLLALANPNDAIAIAWNAMHVKKETGRFFTSEDYAKAMELSAEANKHRIVSNETRKKISDSTKGYKRFLGKHHSEETKKKLSEANKGKPKPEGAGSSPVKIYCIEHSDMIFESMSDAKKIAKELDWKNVSLAGLSYCINGKRNSCGKDSNGNKLHWKKVET